MPVPDRQSTPLDLRADDTGRFRRLFETIDLGVIFHDADGTVIDANAAAERLLGLTLSAMRDLGPVDAAWPGRDSSAPEPAPDRYPVLEVLRTGRPVKGAVLDVVRPSDGRRVWIQVSAFVDEWSVAHDRTTVIATMSDITEHRRAQEELTFQRRLEELLVEIATTYIDVTSADIDASIQNTLERLGVFIGADRFYVFSYDWDANTTSNTHEWCSEGVPPEIDRLQDVPLENIPPWTRTHTAGRTMRVDNVTQLPLDDELRIILEPQGVQSLMAVPIMDGGACVGFVGLDAVRRRRDFSDSEERLLRVFAQMLANVRRRTPIAQVLGGRGSRQGRS